MANLSSSERAGRNCVPHVARLALVLFALVVAAPGASTAGAQPVADEYQVKAAYLLNFARFVEWPTDVLPASAPLNIVIVGDQAFGNAMEEVLHGKTANGHAIALAYRRWNDVLTSYQIVFISASEEAHLPQILHYLGQSGALTVSDIDRFALRGGVIEFRMVGNRLRFDINRAHANAGRLNISSKLLSVARAVHEGSAPR